MGDYIILNNWIPEIDENGELNIYDSKEAKEIVENGNYIQVAKIITLNELNENIKEEENKKIIFKKIENIRRSLKKLNLLKE